MPIRAELEALAGAATDEPEDAVLRGTEVFVLAGAAAEDLDPSVAVTGQIVVYAATVAVTTLVVCSSG